MNQKTLDTLQRALQRQRAVLRREEVTTDTDLQFIAQDREPELEERAQEERASRVLVQRDEREKQEIAEIDSALQRIAEGTYGRCETCGKAIPIARLRALPATRFCVRCASAQEIQAPLVKGEIPRTGRVPPDLSLLSDQELAVLIREQVKNDQRIDMQELKIVCRHGVVYLEGAVPSEAEHRILLYLITDVLGLEDVVDHLRIQELLWEREDRTKPVPSAAPRPPGEELSQTEDIVQSLEEGLDYVPPVKPTPDEE